MKRPDLGMAYVLLAIGWPLGLYRFYIGSRGVGSYMALTPVAVAVGAIGVYSGIQGNHTRLAFGLAFICWLWVVSVAVIAYVDIFRMETLIEDHSYEEELPLRRERRRP